MDPKQPDHTALGIALAGATLAEAMLQELIARGVMSRQDAKDLMERSLLFLADLALGAGASRAPLQEAAAWLDDAQGRIAWPASPLAPAPPD